MSGLAEMELSHKRKEEEYLAMKERTVNYDEMSRQHFEMTEDHHKMALTVDELTAKYNAEHTQNENIKRFFSDLYAETKKPHYGEHAKGVIAQLLLRAQEAGVFHQPEAK